MVQAFNEQIKKLYYSRFILKAADRVGGEIWKCCLLNDNSLGTLSKQMNQMSGLGVDSCHLQKHL